MNWIRYKKITLKDFLDNQLKYRSFIIDNPINLDKDHSKQYGYVKRWI